MGSIIGGGSAKKAAKENAQATRDAAAAASRDAAYAAQANINQINAAIAARAAQQTADELLSKPLESADVDLAVDDESDSGDLITRRRSKRDRYTNAASGNTGLAL